MKKTLLTFIIVLTAGLSAMAQSPEGIWWNAGDLARAGKTIKLNDEKLGFEQRDLLLMTAGGQELLDTWNKYSNMRTWGTWLTVGGGVVLVSGICVGGIYFLAGMVGTIFVAIGGQEAVDKLWADIGPKATAGGIVSLVGLGGTVTGIVLLCVGNSHLTKTVRYCNELGIPKESQLAFGQTRNGIGLSWTF